jgi:hypothetical protein
MANFSFTSTSKVDMQTNIVDKEDQAVDESIFPMTPDTVAMAILYTQNHLPPDATVRDCLLKY